MSRKDIIKSIAPVLDAIISKRKELNKIADDLDTLYHDNGEPFADADRINNLFAAVECLKEAEGYISLV